MTRLKIIFLVAAGFLAGVAFIISCGDKHKSAVASPATTQRVHIDIYGPTGSAVIGTGVGMGDAYPIRFFTNTANESVSLLFTVPKNWDGSSALTFFILWGGFPGSTGDVKWLIRYNRFAVDENMNDLPFASVSSVGSFSDDKIVRTEFTIPAGGTAGPLTPGEAMVLNLYRLSSDPEDTGNTGARLLAAGADYTTQ